MSAEAAGFALADTLYRRQSMVLGDEHLLKAGERLVKHLNRRGYKLTYDPAVIEQAPEPEGEVKPVPVPRLEPKEVEVRSTLAVTLSIGGEDMRCLTCGCWSFYVKENVAFCSSCAASHTIRR
jgi:hypothetical protein